MNQLLSELIIKWYSQNKRDLPWRKNKEPYKVWLSEIMLQQTRVTAVIPYYERFLAELPTISELAAVSEEQLFKLWEGLGYYSRARNLQKAAAIIMQEHEGIFPNEYEQILKLPGIGPYTAGAIASICFDIPVPAVDGNVLRVMARIGELTEDISLPSVKKKISDALMRIYPKSDCGDFTQGLMELGATVCVPGDNPKCDECPIKSICQAFQNGTTDVIPVKKPSKTRKCEEITVLILTCDEKFAIRKREKKGLLSGLWEFPNYAGRLTPEQAMSVATDLGTMPERIAKVAEKTHVFTHIEWDMVFYLIPCNEQASSFLWATEEELRKIYTIPVAFQFPDYIF
jgi:A/G-specific adenine glycosylase